MEAKALKQYNQPSKLSKWANWLKYGLLLALIIYMAWVLLPIVLKVK